MQLGTALNSTGFDRSDAAYLRAVGRYDAVTPESALKLDRAAAGAGPLRVRLRRPAWWTGPARNGKPMHGTTLIWCYDAVLPSWLLSRAWTRAQLIGVMQDHVRTVMDHFEGRVPAWDVVNEAFAATGRGATACGSG